MRTHKFLISLIAITLACAFQSKSATKDISVTLETSRNKIYLGESFDLTLKVEGTSRKLDPDLSEIKDCRIEFLGSRDQTMVSVTRINGKLRRVSETARFYMYRLIPESAGRFVAGPVSVPVNGQTIKKTGPVIQVTGIEKQDFVYIDISASRETALIVDPFMITMKIGIRKLPSPFSSTQPLIPRSPPSLQIPFLDFDPIPGLQNPDIRSILQDKLVDSPRTAGFNINGIELERGLDPFSFGFSHDPFEKRKAKFTFNRRTIEKDGTEYLEYYISLQYRPEEEGIYTFGPVTFKGKIISGVTDGRDLITKDIFAVGPAATVRVVPPPQEGRPEHYVGAIGSNMTVKTAIDSQNCNVGDPLKLTVTIGGDIRLKNTYPPKLDDIPELEDNFRIYSDTVKTLSRQDSRQFVYTIRPVREGTLEIPPMEFAYFDSGAREYRTVSTDPIPVRARKTAQVATNIVISAATDRAPDEEDFHVPAPVYAGKPPDLNTNPWGAKWQLHLLIFPPLLFLAVVIGQKIAPFFAGFETHRKRQLIAPTTILAMKEEFCQSSDPKTKARAIASGLSRYVARRFGSSNEAPTPPEAALLLKESGLPDNLAESCRNIAQRNFDIAYSPEPEFNAQQMENDLVTATELISNIENCLRVKRNRKT